MQGKAMAEQTDKLNISPTLRIVQVGDSVLRSTARHLSVDEIRSKDIQHLIEWMRHTMYDAPGVGLAAPQVGFPFQLAVIEDKKEYLQNVPAEQLSELDRRPVPFQVIINPKITSYGHERVPWFEGCLSLTGFVAVVPRATQVTVDYLDHHGAPQTVRAAGWHARILQHEIGHLQGELYIDHMVSRSFCTVDWFRRNWAAKTVSELKQSLELLEKSVGQ
jgi:peptide deformylase